MAPSLSPNDLAVLANQDSHLAAIIRDKGPGRYALDRVADQWRGRSLADLSAVLGRDLGAELVIEAGNGRLVLHPNGNTWSTRTVAGEVVAPLPPVDPVVIEQRLAACHTCPHHRPESDRCGLCGCGAVVEQLASSPVASCPDRRWPA
jgi:hypothetical protein